VLTARGNTIRNLHSYGGSGSDATANGFTITGGELISTGNTVTTLQCGIHVRGVAATGATVTMTGDILASLTSSSTGSTRMAYGISATSTALTVTGCSISGVTIGNTHAAGIFVSGGSAQVHGNSIADITCSGGGTGTLASGIHVVNAPVTAASNTVTDIHSGGSGDGGPVGILVENTGSAHAVALRGNTVHTLVNTRTSQITQAAGIRATLTGSDNTIERNLVHSVRLSTSTAGANLIQGIHLVAGTGTVRNNMVRLGIDETGASITSPWVTRGIHVEGGVFSVLHNSVYIGGTGVTGGSSFALLSDVTGTRDYRNNILFNARSNGSGGGSHYAIGVNSNLTGLASDHNCLYVSGTGGVLGRQGSTDRTTLSAWQSGTGKDANSISINPVFINATGNASAVDLHIDFHGAGALELSWGGATGTDVPLDFDETARKDIPDIGADELWLDPAFELDCDLSEIDSLLVQGDVKNGHHCLTNNPTVNTGGDYDNKYSLQSFWEPNANTPVITIPIAVHIFHDGSFTGTYPDHSSTVTALQRSVNWINATYAGGHAPSAPQVWHTTSMNPKVRFELGGVFFYGSTGLETDCDMNAKIAHVRSVDADRLKYVGVYSIPITTTCGSSGLFPFPNWHQQAGLSAAGLDGESGIQLSLGFSRIHPFQNALVMSHALGHCLDLLHVYQPDVPDCCRETCTFSDREYVSDIFGQQPGGSCWYPTCGGLDPFDPSNTVTNNIMNGCAIEPPNGYWISDLQAARMHRALAVKSVKDHALDAWGPQPLVVSQDETWDWEMRLYQDVVVEPGVTLTLTCRLEMPTAGRIIVQPGAHLVIDGGIVTTARYSETFWAGVVVLGVTSQVQAPVGGVFSQGRVTMINGAVIEHARVGIRVGDPSDPGSHGGIVRVQGAPGPPPAEPLWGGIFRNCQVGVEFLPYRSIHPSMGIFITNASRFGFARFIVDDDYRGGNDLFRAHVRLNDVNGVGFSACHFENGMQAATLASQLGYGIHSLDAHFGVNRHCAVGVAYGERCPPGDITPSIFIGLDHGIHALGGNSSGWSFWVDECRFENNVIGVYARQATHTMVRNDFLIGGRNVTLDGDFYRHFKDHRGIFSNMCHETFRVEENDLAKTPNATPDASGIVVANSGGENQQVYRNTGSGLDHGYIGEGDCYWGAVEPNVGLQFLCNKNVGNRRNFWARPIEQDLRPDLHSIRHLQGWPADAGNRFDQETTPPLDESDFMVRTIPSITYMMSTDPDTHPEDYTNYPPNNPQPWGRLYKFTAFQTHACASRYVIVAGPELTGGGERSDPADSLRTAFTEAKAAYFHTGDSLASRMDGGDTQGMVALLATSFTVDPEEIRDTLLALAPYVSTTVLMELVQSEILPDSMLTEVLMANPDATRWPGFMHWALNEAPTPLAEAVADSVRASWQNWTERTELRAIAGGHHADMSLAAQLLQDIYRRDSLGLPMDSVLALWQRYPGRTARYAEAWTLMGLGDDAGAYAVVDALEADTTGERDRTLALIALVGDVWGNGRSMMQLDSAEVAQLQVLAEEHGQAAGRAQNILCFGYGICYPVHSGGEDEEEARPGPERKSLRSARDDKEEAPIAGPSALRLFPNPTNGTVTFKYDAVAPMDKAHIVVRDAVGREVARLPLGGANQLTWDARNARPGTYLVELLTEAGRVAVQRLVVKP